MKILLIIFFTFYFVDTINAQEQLTQRLQNIETLRQKGKYVSGIRKVKGMRKKFTKRGIYTDSLKIQLNLSEASCQLDIGNKVRAFTLIEESLILSDSAYKEDKIQLAETLIKITKLFIAYGHHRKAGETLSLAKSIYFENDTFPMYNEREFDLLESRIKIGKGFYNAGLIGIDTYLNDYKDTIKYRSKKKRKLVKEEYAQLLITRANALRYLGDYDRADSNFVANKLKIAKDLGKRSVCYTHNNLLHTRMFEENGMENRRLIKIYEEMYKKASRGRTEGHFLAVEVRQRLMSSYYKADKKSKLLDIEDDMKRVYRRYHKKGNSIYSSFEKEYKFPKKIERVDLAELENDVVNILYLGIAVPKYHQSRIDLINMAYLSAITDKDKVKNAEEYLNEIVNIQVELLGNDAPEFHLARLKLANFYIDNTDKLTEAAEIYADSWGKVISNEFSNTHSSYIETLSHLAVLAAENDDYKQAEDHLDQALYFTRKKWDNTDIKYAEKLEMLARLQKEIGNYSVSINYINEAKEILKRRKTAEEQKLYMQLLASEIPLLVIYGDFKQAEANFLEYQKIKEKNEIQIVDPGSLLEDIAELYLAMGRYFEVEPFLNKTINYKEVRFSFDSRLLIKPLSLQAQYYLSQGKYADAEKSARRSLTIARKTYGTESLKQVPPLRALASLYKNIGDYPRSEQILRSVIDIQIKKLGEDHTDLGMSYSEYALVQYLALSNREEVETLFRKAESIIGATLGSSNPYYAEILKNLAIANINSGQYDISKDYLDLASEIWNKKVNKRKNLHSAEFDVLYGDIKYYQKDYRGAQKFYSSAAQKFESFFNNAHPEYLKVSSKLSKAMYMQQDYRNAQKIIEEVLQKNQEFIKDYFPSLSEREKAKYWSTIKGDYEYYYSVLVAQKRTTDEMVSGMYNNVLLTKSLLLSSSIKMKERIMNSDDEELIKLYQEWAESKDKLTSTLALSDEEIKESGINVGNLTFSLNSLEKQLVQRSEYFAETFDSRLTVWEEVRNAILPSEVAVEMIRFRQFDHTFSDKVYYAILTLSGEQKSKPELLLLENGKEMETRNLTIYRNSMKFKIDDPTSYEVYWKPLAEKFGGASTIFLSPDGVYNQINLESIKLPESNGDYVLDSENIVLVNNTKDLFFKKIKKKRIQEDKVAALFGNPQFYKDTAPGIKIDESGGERATDDIITQLPGTEIEINELEEILGESGWLTYNHMFAEATEASIKAINNPRVFHIATHGFFKVDQGTEGSEDMIAREIVHDPLMRSGLLLKGAGDILNTTDYNFNVNDGILTAYEAMNLNLDQTELVVLSACETGLGAVQAGEGVFGLQRAFLVAGAKAVVMSLFKVSDDATQKLMVNFYKNWLESGDARRSFIDAKKEIRAEYKDPIYWAPFVMIGLN